MLKTIDKETIEFAYDFYFKLDQKQVEEMMTELAKRQSMIVLFFSGTSKELDNTFQLYALFRFALMVDYSFKNYYGNIPSISKQQVKERIDWVIKDIKENPEPSGNTNYPKEIAIAGQVDLLQFIEARCEEFILASDNFPEEEACAIFDAIITMTFLYQQEIEKMNINS